MSSVTKYNFSLEHVIQMSLQLVNCGQKMVVLELKK